MMKRRPAYFLLLSFVAVALCSCVAGPRVIPRKTLSKIYAEMFMMDEWTQSNRATVSRLADTSFVYEPIFRKYGYDTDDYVKSVGKYLEDPERFSRILRDTESELGDRLSRLKEEKRKALEAVRLQHRRDSIREFWSISIDSMKTALLVDYPVDTQRFDIILDSLFLRADSLETARRDSLAAALRDSSGTALRDSAAAALRDSSETALRDSNAR